MVNKWFRIGNAGNTCRLTAQYCTGQTAALTGQTAIATGQNAAHAGHTVPTQQEKGKHDGSDFSFHSVLFLPNN